MKERQKSFVLYGDQREHINLLSDEEAGQLFKAVYNYALTHEKPEFGNRCVAMAFSFISLQMDRDAEKYIEVCEHRRTAGKKGGAPLGNKNAAKSDKTTNCLKKQPKRPDNENDNNNDNENDTDNDNESDNEINACGSPAPAECADKCFAVPSAEEINAYCRETGKPIDAQGFISYYNSNGWKVGQNPMRDWKAAVIRWRKRDEESGKVYSPSPREKTSYDISEIEKSSFALYK